MNYLLMRITSITDFYENRFIGNYSKFNVIDYGKKMPYLNGRKWSK